MGSVSQNSPAALEINSRIVRYTAGCPRQTVEGIPMVVVVSRTKQRNTPDGSGTIRRSAAPAAERQVTKPGPTVHSREIARQRGNLIEPPGCSAKADPAERPGDAPGGECSRVGHQPVMLRPRPGAEVMTRAGSHALLPQHGTKIAVPAGGICT